MHKRLFIHDESNPEECLKAQVRDGEIILIKGDTEVSLATYENAVGNGNHINLLVLNPAEQAWLDKMKPLIGGEISRQAGHSFNEGDIILVPVMVKKMTPQEQAAAGMAAGDDDTIVFTKIPIFEQFTKNGQGRPVFKAVPPDRHRYGTDYHVAMPTTMRARNHDEIQTKGVVCICVSEIPEGTIFFRVIETRRSTLLVRAVKGDEVENLYPMYEYRPPKLSAAEAVEEFEAV